MLVGGLVFLGKGFRMPFCRGLREHIMERGIQSTSIPGFVIRISPCRTLAPILTYLACASVSVLYRILYTLSFGVGTCRFPADIGPFGLPPSRKNVRIRRAL